MKFYYDLLSGHKGHDTYYNEKTIRTYRVYPATPEIEKASLEQDSCLWPVHDPYGASNECVECKDINEAYEYILESENQSIYEYVNDI